MNLQLTDISRLTPDPHNVRLHPERNLQAIAASLSEFGQRKPIVITESGVVLAGNGILEAAQRLGWSQIYTITAPSTWTPEQIRAFAIVDNQSPLLATWNTPVLAAQLDRLAESGFTPASLGFHLADEPTMSLSGTREIDPDGFAYDHTCVGCGFQFND